MKTTETTTAKTSVFYNFMSNVYKMITAPAPAWTHALSSQSFQDIISKGYNLTLAVLVPLLGKSNPTVTRLMELEDFFQEIRENGGAKVKLKKMIEDKKEHCATEANMEVKEIDTLVLCIKEAIKSDDDDLMEKTQEFATCNGFNFANFAGEAKEIIKFIQCAANDIKSSVLKLKEAVSDFNPKIINSFSKIITEIENSGALKAALQTTSSKLISDCAHTVGGMQEAQKTAVCFDEMRSTKGGINQKLESFIECDDITLANAAGEVQNAMSFMYCLNENIQDNFSSLAVDVNGDSMGA